MNWDEAIAIFEAAPGSLCFKDRYRWLARNGELRHPDRGGTDAGFRKLNDAYLRVSGKPPALGSWKTDADTLFGESKVSKESLFQSKVKGALEKQGAFVFNCHGGVMQQAGMPDLWIQHPWWHGWVELKVDRRKLESLQEITMEKIRKRGGQCQVWRLFTARNVMCIQIPVHGVGVLDIMEAGWPMIGKELLDLAIQAEGQCP